MKLEGTPWVSDATPLSQAMGFLPVTREPVKLTQHYS